MQRLRNIAIRCARALELVLCAVFVAGAILKARDINLFIVQISYYGVVSEKSLQTFSALGTLWVESALGIALLLGCRARGLTFAALLALLAAFTGLIAYGWAFHGLKDCGCFGPVEISPSVSIAKNVALALLAGAAWWGFAAGGRLKASWRRFLLSAATCIIAASGTAFYSHLQIEPPVEADRPFAQFVFEVEGQPFDLGKGEYLVVLLSMTCPHCMDSVPGLNELLYTPDVPPVVALCYEEKPGALDEFRDSTGAEFPMYSLGNSRVLTFFTLLGDGKEPPRIVYVRDGSALVDWFETAPTPDEVLDAITPLRPSSPQ